MSILRIFDTQYAEGEPVLIPPFVVAAAIRFYKNEIGTHKFEVMITDEKGAEMKGSTEIVAIAEMTQDSMIYFLICNMPERLCDFGTYWFTIESGGKQLARIPLYVTRGRA